MTGSSTIASTLLDLGTAATAAGFDPTAVLDHVKDGELAFGQSWWYSIGLTKMTFMFLLAGLLTILFFWSHARTAGKRKVPSRWGAFVESIILFIRDQMTRPFLGEEGDRFVPFVTSLFVFIAICNLLGMVPFFDALGHGGNTATGNIVLTASLAICAFSYYHFHGIREQGLFTYVKNIFPHVPAFVLPVIVVVEILAHIVKPCALAIRLFANMFAGHTMMAVLLAFTNVLSADLPVGLAVSIPCFLAATALSFLELLVALIQAFVFAFLTTVFLAGAIHPEH